MRQRVTQGGDRMAKVIEGIKLITHNAGGVNDPDDLSYPWQPEMQQKIRRCLCGQPAGSFGYCIDCEKYLEEAYREEQDLMQVLF